MSKHLLITGRPGVGKTTLIQKIIEFLKDNKPDWTLTGFWTCEVRQNSQRIGFDINTLNGYHGILARRKDLGIASRKHVGKYSVDISDFETIAVPALYEPADLVIIDEVGKMELFSSKFKEAVQFVLDNQPRVLATVPFYEDSFLATIKSRADVQLWELTRENREKTLQKIQFYYSRKR